MNFDLKDRFLSSYNRIQEIQDMFEHDIGDLTPADKERLRMELADQYLYIGNTINAIALLQEYINQWITPRNILHSELPVRAFILVVLLLVQEQKLDEAGTYLSNFKAYLNREHDEKQLLSAAKAYANLLDVLLLSSKDEGSVEEDIRLVQDFYRDNRESLPMDMRLTILEMNAIWSFKKGLEEQSMEYWNQELALIGEQGVNEFRLNEVYKKIAYQYELAGDVENAFIYYQRYSNGRDEVWGAKEYANSQFLLSEYGIRAKTEQMRILEECNRTLGVKAYEDSLTSLYNRRHLTRMISDFFENNTGVSHWSAIMFDIDFFKQYNDNYGHLKGDRILMKIGEILNSFRSSVVTPVRYGGEEFLVLVQGQSITETEILAHTVMRRLKDMHLAHAFSEADGIVTMSAGVAELDCHEGKDLVLLCERADKALYESKNSGRNTCTIYKG